MEDWFRKFSNRVGELVGTWWAFCTALGIVLTWAITGPLFHYSDSWQLVINTGTTVVTFLMVFLIQKTQNRDAKAVSLKIDELIRSSKARNAFLDLDGATDEELKALEDSFKKIAEKRSRHRREHGTTGERVHSHTHTREQAHRHKAEQGHTQTDAPARSYAAEGSHTHNTEQAHPQIDAHAHSPTGERAATNEAEQGQTQTENTH